MYFEEIKQALRLSKAYSIENLKVSYEAENQSAEDRAQQKSMAHSFVDLWTMIEVQGLYGSEPIDSIHRLSAEEYEELSAKPISDLTSIERDKLLEEIEIRIKEIDDKLGKLPTPFSLKDKSTRNARKSKETNYNAILNEFSKFIPEDSFSQAYCIRYIKTCLWYFVMGFNDPIRTDLYIRDWTQFFKHNIGTNAISGVVAPIVDVIAQEEQSKTKDLEICKRRIKQYIIEDVRKSNSTLDDLARLCFYGQVISFIIAVIDSADRKIASYENEAISYIAYFIANGLLTQKRALATETALVAKKGLNITNPSDRQDAFNILGISAIESGQKQLAYDTYFSWLNRCVVGELKELIPDSFLLSDDEERWRKEIGRTAVALMKGNFSYVSAIISETYEPNSERWEVFHTIALNEIKGAMELDKEDSGYHCTYGTLLSENTDYNETELLDALEHFSIYKNGNLSLADELDSYRVYCTALLDIITEDLTKHNDKMFSHWAADEKIQKFFSEFKTELEKYFKFPQRDDTEDRRLVKAQKTRRSWEPSFKLHKMVKQYDNVPETHKVELILMIIWHMATLLQNRLRRWEYNPTDYYSRIGQDNLEISRKRENIRPIAYYTTLNTVKFVFDDLYQDTPYQAPHKTKGDKKGNNCLTVMHAKYMNDPHEGLALLKEFLSAIEEEGTENILFLHNSPISFRESIYNNQFIFLKSFTERIDNLVMWNRYASDYNADGKNSNGCCVQLDAEAFGKLVDSSISTEVPIKLENAPEDDYYLYRVVYISRNGEIKESDNPGLSPRVVEYYKTLQMLISTLNQQLYQIRKRMGDKGDTLIDYVRGFLQQTLRFIIFLFKDSDYSDEVESRLIFVRTPNQQEEIRLLPTSPEKLCINPFFQVYISKIMFGPNVRDQELWTPFLQYQLNKMWKKHPALADKSEDVFYTHYSIENSKIHYHT